MLPCHRHALVLALLTGCTGPSTDAGSTPSDDDTGAPEAVPWTPVNPPSSELWPAFRGLQPQRAVVHLHSPWSHDACDGEPLIDGVPDAACLAALRAGLCTTRMDHAFLTDHPAHASGQDWQALFHAQDGDTWLTDDDGVPLGMEIDCGDGHAVRWYAGIEDTLMPVALRDHAGDTEEARDHVYDTAEAESIAAIEAVDGLTLVAHTEGREPELLEALSAQGLVGFEVFNLHAAFDPGIRKDDLGLDSVSWLSDIGPFVAEDGTAEPDLFVLAVLLRQDPSFERWDRVLTERSVVGTGGTDAHQNVLPTLLRDGERGDSYRRMLRWLSNVLLVDEAAGPEGAAEALAAGRAWVVFDVLGAPTELDLHVVGADGQTWELGSTVPASALPGTLVVPCPTVSASSPRDGAPAEVELRVLRDGAEWADGCGDHVLSEAGVYRVEVDMVPHHLAGFLGDDPDPWLRRYPWLVSNALRVGMAR